jgi:hypothetical protein
MTEPTPSETRPWTPPIWLRRLRMVAEEQRQAGASRLSHAERFRLACELMAFARSRLEEEAARRGSSVSALLVMYERASDRLRARG